MVFIDGAMKPRELRGKLFLKEIEYLTKNSTIECVDITQRYFLDRFDEPIALSFYKEALAFTLEDLVLLSKVYPSRVREDVVLTQGKKIEKALFKNPALWMRDLHGKISFDVFLSSKGCDYVDLEGLKSHIQAFEKEQIAQKKVYHRGKDLLVLPNLMMVCIPMIAGWGIVSSPWKMDAVTPSTSKDAEQNKKING